MTTKSIPIKPVHTPPAADIRLPAEWAAQSGVMLTWPNTDNAWGKDGPAVERVFLQLAAEISRRELVLIVLDQPDRQSLITGALRIHGADPATVRFAFAPSNDVWARDHGPISVRRDGQPVLLDFQFNAWGGKYPFDHDNHLTQRIHDQGVFSGIPIESVDLVLEGGSIESDGEGTLLTTIRCLLSPARNPKLDRAGLEARLAELLGIHQILWLDRGFLAGDDTDSHIDTLARFCGHRTIAYVACPDHDDEHYEELGAMAMELAAMRTADGHPFRLVPLPWPRAKLNAAGDRLPATYANFVIVNSAVLVPLYEDPADPVALERLRTCFPDRDIIGIPSLPLIHQYGSLHCVTMQLPAGVLT